MRDTHEHFRCLTVTAGEAVAHQVLLCRFLKPGRAEMRSGARFMFDAWPRSLVEAVEKAINKIARRPLKRTKAK
jgi:hypothetical protein